MNAIINANTKDIVKGLYVNDTNANIPIRKHINQIKNEYVGLILTTK